MSRKLTKAQRDLREDEMLHLRLYLDELLDRPQSTGTENKIISVEIALELCR